MSKRVKRSRKLNSDNDSLFLNYEDAPDVGQVPYSNVYDYGQNGINHIITNLEFFDTNYFKYGPDENMVPFVDYRIL